MLKNISKWFASLTQPAQVRPRELPSSSFLSVGQQAEDWAVLYLQQAGLDILARNYKTPGRGGGEVDIIAMDNDTLVFVEVRLRSHHEFGGAAASVDGIKQKRIIKAAQHYMLACTPTPPCRFDVIASNGDGDLQWFKAAFSVT